MTHGDDLPAIIDALRSPAAYPHAVDGGIAVLQTHISYVLLAGAHAYKIKKPLNLGFLDYSTLERRRALSDEEVRLNRRLCDGVYIGVEPVTRSGVGDRDGYRFGGDGPPVEYAVHMRRVPRERMLDALLETGTPASDIVRAVARKMAAFHATAETDDRIAGFGSPAQLRENWDENVTQLAPLLGGEGAGVTIERVRAFAHAFLDADRGLLEERAASGRVRDCHGDLRSDAVYAREDGGICIMDCIEFNDRIRYGDVAGDIAFLAMDLRYRGHRDLADELLGAYLTASADETLPLVLAFYECYRAVVRAKVEALRAGEPEVPAADRAAALEASLAYLRLADTYCDRARPQVAIVMYGLSGSGKSYLADALACRIGAVVLNTDVLRGAAPGDRAAPAFGAGRYTQEAREDVYVRLRDRAREHLDRGRSAVLDATHLSRTDRDAARDLARRCGVPSLIVEVAAGDALVREHFAAREREGGAPSEATWEVYQGQKAACDPLGDDEGPRVTVDAAQPLSANIESILAAVDR